MESLDDFACSATQHVDSKKVRRHSPRCQHNSQILVCSSYYKLFLLTYHIVERICAPLLFVNWWCLELRAAVPYTHTRLLCTFAPSRARVEACRRHVSFRSEQPEQSFSESRFVLRLGTCTARSEEFEVTARSVDLCSGFKVPDGARFTWGYGDAALALIQRMGQIKERGCQACSWTGDAGVSSLAFGNPIRWHQYVMLARQLWTHISGKESFRRTSAMSCGRLGSEFRL